MSAKDDAKKSPVLLALGIGAVIVFIYQNTIGAESDDGFDDMVDPYENERGGNDPGDMSLPRGIRNNNPLNIKLTSIPWQGKVPNNQNTDGTFEQFIDIDYGYRAAIKNIVKYFNDYDLDTVRAIISRWSTGRDSYINFVANNMGISPDFVMHDEFFAEHLWPLIQGMAIYENGQGNAHLIKFDDYIDGLDLV